MRCSKYKALQSIKTSGKTKYFSIYEEIHIDETGNQDGMGLVWSDLNCNGDIDGNCHAVLVKILLTGVQKRTWTTKWEI